MQDFSEAVNSVPWKSYSSRGLKIHITSPARRSFSEVEGHEIIRLPIL